MGVSARLRRGTFSGVLVLACISVRISAQTPDADASPSSSVVKELPEGVSLSGEIRSRTEGHTGAGLKQGDDYGQELTRVRLSLDVTRYSWFRLFVQAQDSRFINVDDAKSTAKTTDSADFEQAFFELKPPELSWMSLRAGRQEVFYGDQRLLSDSGWPNTGGVFDALKLTVGNSDMHVDLLGLSPIVVSPYNLNWHATGERLYGGYGTWKGIARASVGEAYFLWKKVDATGTYTTVPGPADIYTAGGRWETTLQNGFDFSGEAAQQWGHRAAIPVLAWGGYGTASYSMNRRMWQPRFSAEYGYGSGSRAGGSVYGAFDPLYPKAHGPYGFTDLASWKNIRHLRTSFAVKPMAKLSLQFDLHLLSLASKYDGLYDATRTLIVAAPASGAVSTDVGRETDVSAIYAVRSDLKATIAYGHLFPGGFLEAYRPGCSSSFPYLSLEYKF